MFFAGCTVIIALMGLTVLGLGSLQGVAVAVALTVLVTMLASLTLLPALLAIFGGRIERAVRRRAAPGHGRPRAPVAALVRCRAAAAVARARSFRVVALAALCVPPLGIHLGFADAGNDPRTKTSRQAYDLLAEGFGPGVNGPLLVLVRGWATGRQAAQRALAGADGVAA